MDKQVLYVSLVCGFLGLLSIILGFTAEVTKIKATDVYVNIYYECYHPSSPAFGTAIGAVLLLVLAQILVTVFGGCCGCCKKDPTVPVILGTKRTLAIVFVVISWITFAISVILFISGAARNGTGNHTTSLDVNGYCYSVKPGIFAGAAICALFTMTFSIASYILLSPSIDAAGKPTGVQYGNGIAMGTPQFPQTQQQYPDPGMGGTQYPEPGVGGTQYPAPGVGGTEYPPPGTNYSTV